ncbi:MAG: hypothetical protein Q7T71_10075 [Herbiconiux sp.]|nr:hypothetical protein [Herbiconiux sp.]
MATAVSASGDGFGMTCSESYGCRTENAVLVTLVTFGYRVSMPLLVSGILFLAGSLALAALEHVRADEMDTVSAEKQKPPTARHTVAMRLWFLAGILILGSLALGLWSASPAGQASTLASDGDRSSPQFILFQMSYSIVPAGILSGLLVTGLALLVTRARPLGERPRHSSDLREPDPWDGTNLEPFKRPTIPESPAAPEN